MLSETYQMGKQKIMRKGPGLESKMDDRAKIRKNNLENHLKGERQRRLQCSQVSNRHG